MTAITRNPRAQTRHSVPLSRSQRSKWKNRDVAFTPALPSLHVASFSSQGLQAQDVISSFSGVYRQWGSLPISQWTTSGYYPDTPVSPGFQLLGSTSLATSGFGVMDTCRAVKSAKQARETGDKKGVYYSAAEGTVGAIQTAYSPVVGTYRAASIGSVLQATDPVASAQWAQIGKHSGMGVMSLLTALYGVIGAIELRKARDSYNFQHKVDKHTTPTGKLAYLKQRLRADEQTLIAKEKKKLCKQEPDLRYLPKKADKLARANIEAQGKAIALKQQTTVLKEQIALMRKFGVCKKGFTLDQEQLEQVVKKRFNDKGLIAHGKELLIATLKQKKITKMNRLVGEKAVQQIEQARGVDPIVLADIDKSSSNIRSRYVKRAALYITGTVLTALSIFLTGGIAPIVLGIGLGLVYSVEMYWSYKRMQALRKDDSSPPGTRDKMIPKASLALNVAVAGTIVALACFYPISLSALLLTGIGLLFWAGINCRQLTYISERKEKYIDKLMQKPRLELPEFYYIVTQAAPKQVERVMEAAFAKLSQKEQQILRKSIDIQKSHERIRGRNVDHESIEQRKKRYQEAMEKRVFELQKLSLQSLAFDLEQEFGVEGIRQE